MPHFNIEKEVEITPQRNTRPSKNQDFFDALARMEVGDSFTFPVNRTSSLHSVQSTLRRRGVTKRYTMRKEDAVTARVWRTE